MSWVLILNSDWTHKSPAVVGGYETLEQAEAAADAATAFNNDGPFPTAPYYTRYMIIPGCAAGPSAQTVHGEIIRGDNQRLIRVVRRFPE